jgi:pilus assembly protein Flp/PilA
LLTGETQNHTEEINLIKGEKQMERIKNFFKDESGASAVEYGLLVALIAVGLIGAMSGLKDSIATAFTNAADSLK